MSRGGRGGGLAVYVTSHGFGHLSRTAAVLNRLPHEIPVSIRSDASLFGLWPLRVVHPISLTHYVADSGAVNPPGDSAVTDGPATLELAARVYGEAMARLDDEVDWLRDHRIDSIACDAPAPPLVAARRAGIPGFLMSNFTWADIYAPYARYQGGDSLRLVAELRRAYRHATALLRMQPALTMSWLEPAIDVGMVVHQGRNLRDDLLKELGLSPSDRIVYFYIGRYGQDDLDWSRLERFGARGIHFVGYDPVPAGGPKNVHTVSSHGWSGGRLIASTDAVVAKAGYSTACEAIASGTAMIYPPRRGFAEFRSLDRALRSWAGGIPVSTREFQGLRLERALERALAIEPGPPPFPTDGAARIAGILARACRNPAAASEFMEASS
jgi:hypothetical protein